MRTSAAALLLPIALLGCRNEGSLGLRDPGLELEITSPEYGDFLGFGDFTVEGTVSPPVARVFVEGDEVAVRADGTWSATLPFDNRYRNIDVDATMFQRSVSKRLPVFDGSNPLDAWPGGMTLRLTPAALARIGENLGQVIDDTGWSDGLDLSALGNFEIEGLDIQPGGVVHDPTVVVLDPVEGGIEVGIELRNVAIEADVTIMLGDYPLTVPATFGYEDIRITALTTPEVDDDGYLFLTMGEGGIEFGDPVIEVAGFFDASFMDPILDQLTTFIDPIGDLVLGFVTDAIGTVPLGGPYVFNQDLMGTEIEVRLSEVFGDPDGLGGGLGMGFDEPVATGPIGMPTPIEHGQDVHLALGMHEALVQVLIEQANITEMLSQDIVLPGALGNIIGTSIRNLPGGDSAPEGDGWCMALEPGQAYVARLSDGIEPLGTVYLPDTLVDIGIQQGGVCESWLATSLALEVNLVVTDGTKVGVDIQVAEGAVLAYGYDGAYVESEVIDGLGGFVEASTSLIGGNLEFDLADLMGGGAGPVGGIPGVGDVSMSIVGAHALTDEVTGEHPEGLYTLQLGLFE